MDLDELDRECALAQGWVLREDEWTHPDHPKEVWFSPPSPTRNWEDFGALLLWLGKNGSTWMTSDSPVEWSAGVMDDAGNATDCDPRLALALAVAAWRKGVKP